MENKNTSNATIGLCDILAVVFIVLKLCHVIEWSWWWVLSPIWIPCGIGLIVVGIVWIIERKNKKKI